MALFIPEILNWLKELREKHGSVFRIWFGKDLMVMFTDPEDIKQPHSTNAFVSHYQVFT